MYSVSRIGSPRLESGKEPQGRPVQIGPATPFQRDEPIVQETGDGHWYVAPLRLGQEETKVFRR